MKSSIRKKFSKTYFTYYDANWHKNKFSAIFLFVAWLSLSLSSMSSLLLFLSSLLYVNTITFKHFELQFLHLVCKLQFWSQCNQPNSFKKYVKYYIQYSSRTKAAKNWNLDDRWKAIWIAICKIKLYDTLSRPICFTVVVVGLESPPIITLLQI